MKNYTFLLFPLVLIFNGYFLINNTNYSTYKADSTACPAPIINTFNPASGPVNTEITIDGSNFSTTSSVDFNGVTASFTILSDTEISITVPSGVTDSSNITLTTSGGCDTTTATSFSLLNSDCNSADEIYISEVYDSDGGSYGVIELYNPTNTAISLNTIYEVQRFGDIGNATPSATIPLEGSIAPLSTYIIEMGGTGNTCSGLTAGTSVAAGINEDDEIKLVKNGTVIDVMYTDDEIGYSFIRNADAASPSTTFNLNEWLLLEDEDCSNLGSHTADSSSTPNITHPNNQAICENSTATFSVSVNTGSYSYQWLVLNTSGNWVNVSNDSNYSGATTSTLNITNTPASFNGLQYYCMMSSTGCNLVSNAAHLEVSNPEVDTLPNQTVCSIYTLPVLTNGNYYTGTNGTGTQLNAGDIITSFQTIYIFNTSGTAPNTCQNESSFTVSISGNPLVSVLEDQTVCSEYVLPSITNGNYFTAADGNGTPLNAGEIISTSQTIYIYNEVGVAPNICTNESSFDVSVTGTPNVDTLSDVSICSEFILPNLTDGNYFTGTNGTGTQLNAGAIILTSQTIYIYNEIGTTTDTCNNESSFDVTIYPSTDFTLTDSNIEINGDSITITMSDTSIEYEYAIDGSSFQNENTFTNVSEGTHTLYVQDSNGCIVKSIAFEIATAAEELIIPTGFSPNNDDKNEWFNIQGLYDVYTNHKLEVYNRYGTLIFEGNNNKKWFGIANKGLMHTDKVLPVGTYFYVLYLNEPNTNSKPFTGWVYLNK
ncbi:T9SS type B sorting domain-containing protein [Winogradskyella thalassocola]|uniref:Gliding motility-associated C-terminal domain-containing protein n=1 Tax=Winogradskyella thalassocola TaxID=262004 RepID=A0A1G8EWL4_9FLAO|nr:gliding motility-associated C-terminal domain-containing protein [Winogradskyella thalassocola]SDH74291.1 gliding motility-associated C-terminal domain-containing protein [Winogradskyella thalassocola]